jgi:preprotein translocase subunit YajC
MRPVTVKEQSMFVTPAYAQAAGGAQDQMPFLLMMALIFVVFYFFMIRPQQQKQKDLKKMLEALRRGDRVVTAGGIVGTIVKAEPDECQIEIADNVRVRVLRNTITAVLAKPDPAAAKKGTDAAADKKDGDKKTPELVGADEGGGMQAKVRSGFRRLLGG